MIRFIHTADLHLDQTFTQFTATNESLAQELNRATEKSFFRLIDTAINENVDFVVISGDIFNGERASLQAQFTFKKGMDRLNQAKIPAIISYGNHDYVKDNKHRIALPSNVHVFSSTIETIEITIKNGESVAFSGFSYGERWISENMAIQFPDRAIDCDFHIGLYHGDVTRNKNKKQYAPFKLSDLRVHGYDYWALGHIHQRQQLSANPPTMYPGNIQGAHFKELGPKGALLVTIEKGIKAQFEFIETNVCQFTESVTDLPKIDSLERLRDVIERALHEQIMYAKNENINIITRLKFATDGDKESLYWWNNYADELLEQLQWSLGNQYHSQTVFVYLANIELIISDTAEWSASLAFNESLKRAYTKYEQEQTFDEILVDLFKNDQWQKHMAGRIDKQVFQTDVLNHVKELVVLEQANQQYEQRRG